MARFEFAPPMLVEPTIEVMRGARWLVETYPFFAGWEVSWRWRMVAGVLATEKMADAVLWLRDGYPVMFRVWRDDAIELLVDGVRRAAVHA